MSRGRGQRLESEHDARELAAGHDARERAQVLARIGRDVELGAVDTLRGPRGLIVEPFEADLETRPLHGEIGKHPFQLPRELAGDTAALAAQRCPPPRDNRPGGRPLALEFRQPFVGEFESRRFDAQRVAPRDGVLEPRTVLAFDPFEKSEPVLDFLQLCRRRLDPVRIPAEEPRQILELRLDAVARVEIGLKLRVHARELANPPPHAAERRQRRIVAVVERRIAFFAEALEALRVRENVAGRFELRVLAIAQRGAIEFGQLKRCKLLASAALRPRLHR